MVTEALQWLDKNKQEPFFLNVWFNEPHFPMAAPEELKKRHAINPEYYGCIENMDIAIGKLMNYLKNRIWKIIRLSYLLLIMVLSGIILICHFGERNILIMREDCEFHVLLDGINMYQPV